MANFDRMKLAVEMLTGGKNTVLYDDYGMPSVMVVIPKMLNSALVTGAADTTHPAFIVNGTEKDKAYFSKYINIVKNERAYSLPMQDPASSLNIDRARTYCRNKGAGWSLTPASLWSAVALQCKKAGFMPHGNNQYGKDNSYPYEVGVGTTIDTSDRINHTATGSGPVTWNHDGTNAGIADMNGNVSEWCDGIRIQDGEIQIVPDADCMLATSDMSATSALWKAILQDGSLVAGGTADTLKLSGSKVITGTSDTDVNMTFQSLTADTGVTIPDILKELTLFPADADGYENDKIIGTISGERVFYRGGNYTSGVNAGVFCSYFSYSRYYSGSNIGFRSAFYEV